VHLVALQSEWGMADNRKSDQRNPDKVSFIAEALSLK